MKGWLLSLYIRDLYTTRSTPFPTYHTMRQHTLSCTHNLSGPPPFIRPILPIRPAKHHIPFTPQQPTRQLIIQETTLSGLLATKNIPPIF